MQTIDRILARHYRPIGLAGAEPPAQALVDDLNAHYRFNVRLYALVLVLMVATLLGMAGLVLATPALAAKEFIGALAALGGLAAAFVEMARRTVREWSQARLLATVARSLSHEQLTNLVAKLLEAGKS